jgi:tRNA(Ile2) C34 agmatinyltransferase TiaS
MTDIRGPHDPMTTQNQPNPLTCPKCGQSTPAAFKRSDGVTCFRCDRCGHEWGAPQLESAADDLPPIASIDAPGG